MEVNVCRRGNQPYVASSTSSAASTSSTIVADRPATAFDAPADPVLDRIQVQQKLFGGGLVTTPVRRTPAALPASVRRVGVRGQRTEYVLRPVVPGRRSAPKGAVSIIPGSAASTREWSLATDAEHRLPDATGANPTGRIDGAERESWAVGPERPDAPLRPPGCARHHRVSVIGSHPHAAWWSAATSSGPSTTEAKSRISTAGRLVKWRRFPRDTRPSTPWMTAQPYPISTPVASIDVVVVGEEFTDVDGPAPDRPCTHRSV